MTRDFGDPGDWTTRSSVIRCLPDGKKNVLDAVHHSWPRHGLHLADLVERGAHTAAAGGVLVGGV